MEDEFLWAFQTPFHKRELNLYKKCILEVKKHIEYIFELYPTQSSDLCFVCHSGPVGICLQ
jgi:hypothetical protein